jgi:hypothetical protein
MLWTAELNEQLSELVIDHMFEFEAVVEELQGIAPELAGQITVVACREQYSYLDSLAAEPPEPPAVHDHTVDVHDDVRTPPPGVESVEDERPPSSRPISDIMQQVEDQELMYKERKDKLFSDVLTSLGGPTTEHVDLPEDIERAMARRKEYADQQRTDKAIRSSELKERERWQAHYKHQEERWNKWEGEHVEGGQGRKEDERKEERVAPPLHAPQVDLGGSLSTLSLGGEDPEAFLSALDKQFPQVEGAEVESR